MAEQVVDTTIPPRMLDAIPPCPPDFFVRELHLIVYGSQFCPLQLEPSSL